METGITGSEVLTELVRLDRTTLAKVRHDTGGVDRNLPESQNAAGTDALQLEWERKDTFGEIETVLEKLRSIAPEAAADFRTKIAQVGTAATIGEVRKLKADILGDIQKATELAASDRTFNDSESREAIADRMRAYHEKAHKMYEHLAAAGYGNENYEKKRKELEEKLTLHATGTSEWLEIQTRILTLDKDYFGTTRDKAYENGDHQLGDEADKARKEAEKELNGLSALPIQAKRKDGISSDAVSGEDDNAPPAFLYQNTDITSNDVSAPITPTIKTTLPSAGRCI